jgi:hypothetical protein
VKSLIEKVLIFSVAVGLLCLSSGGGSRLSAAENKIDISKMTAEEIGKLPKKEQMNLLAEDVFKKIIKEKVKKKNMFLIYAIPLSKLLYFQIDERNVRKAIKKFQRDIDAPTTGKLTMGQLQELSRRSSRVGEGKIITGLSSMSIYTYNNTAIVEGTWVVAEEKLAYPVNSSIINCEKKLKRCTEFVAEIRLPDFNDEANTSFLNLRSDIYRIISWDRNEIVAEKSGECTITTLTLNFNSNEVLAITRNNQTKRCNKSPINELFKIKKLKKPQIAKLVPGFNVTFKIWNDRRKKASKFFNSEIRNIGRKDKKLKNPPSSTSK